MYLANPAAWFKMLGVWALSFCLLGAQSEREAVQSPVLPAAVEGPVTPSDSPAGTQERRRVDAGSLTASERGLVSALVNGRVLSALSPAGSTYTDATYTDDRCGETTHVEAFVRRNGDPNGPGESFELTRCAATFAEAHRQMAAVIASPTHRVQVSPVAVTANGTTVFSLSDFCDAAAREQWHCISDYVSVDWVMRSLVGPIVTLRVFKSEAGGGGPPYHGEEWKTIDLRTGKTAALDAIVTPASLVEALANDPYLRANLPKQNLLQLDAATTLAESHAAWSPLREAGSHAYAFHDGADDQGRIIIRVAFLSQYCGLCPNTLSTLGLWVEPKRDARIWFEAARRGGGLLPPP
ncbi:MAG: hypothetical protein ACR2RL_21395 [Gammaproteobacteria bacterium]